MLLPTFDSTKNQEKKKKRKRKSKTQEDIHEKKPKRLLKLMVKDQITSGKVEGPKYTKIL